MGNRRNLWIVVLLFIFCLTACGSSPKELDLHAIQTSEAQITVQVLPTSTSPLARFINPPEYLEEKYKSTSGWNWMEAVEGRRSAFQDSKNYQTTFFLVHEQNLIEVGETGSFSDTFITNVLDQFVPSATREKIIQFRNDHTAAGTYQTAIDGFVVELYRFEGIGNYSIAVIESK